MRYFGLIDKIIDSRKTDHPVNDFRKYKSYKEGDFLIILERDSIIELNNEIPFRQGNIQRFRYTTLDKFINVKNTSDLWD